MPSNKNYVRNYREEAAAESPERKKERAMRISARRAYEKASGQQIPKGFDLDHRTPLSQGGSNAPSNWRIQRASKNRSYPRKPDGSMK